MTRLTWVIGLLAAAAVSDASAQMANLTGVFTCVEKCRGGQPAQITQNGAQLNIVTEAGTPSRAWPDWFSPTSRIWVDALNEGAVYSPDGMRVQFDNGTIWLRGLPPVRRR